MSESAKAQRGMIWGDGNPRKVLSWDRAHGEDFTTFVQAIQLPDQTLAVVRTLRVFNGGRTK